MYLIQGPIFFRLIWQMKFLFHYSKSTGYHTNASPFFPLFSGFFRCTNYLHLIFQGFGVLMLHDFTCSSDLPEPRFALSGKSSVFSPSPCCHGCRAASGSFHSVTGIQGAAHITCPWIARTWDLFFMKGESFKARAS